MEVTQKYRGNFVELAIVGEVMGLYSIIRIVSLVIMFSGEGCRTHVKWAAVNTTIITIVSWLEKL